MSVYGGRGAISQTEQDLFWLAVILILVVYFVGASTDVATVGSVVNNLGNTFTGRSSSGTFAQYPTNPNTAVATF